VIMGMVSGVKEPLLATCRPWPLFSLASTRGDLLYFYDAQRSRKLPASNRIPWRKDCPVNDCQAGDVDLLGGFTTPEVGWSAN
jgi:Glycosyl hydrolase family 9